MSRTYYQLSLINWEINKTLDLLVNFANLKSKDPGRIFLLISRYILNCIHIGLWDNKLARVRGDIENAFMYVDILIIVGIRHLLIMEVTWACIYPRNYSRKCLIIILYVINIMHVHVNYMYRSFPPSY